METKEVKPACGKCKWAKEQETPEPFKFTCTNEKSKGKKVYMYTCFDDKESHVATLKWPMVISDWWCDRFEPKEEGKTLADEFWKKDDASCLYCTWFRRDQCTSMGYCFYYPPTSGDDKNRPPTHINDFCSKFQARRKNP